MRLLIIVVLAFLLYRVLKRLIVPRQRMHMSNNMGAVDEMVQDPFCKTYIPLRSAQRKVIQGQEYFFCSKECADRFEKEMKPGSSKDCEQP